MTKKKRERNNQPTKQIKYIEVPAVNVEQHFFRDMLKQMYKNEHGDVEYCAICGDTAKECELFKMMGGQIICKDCVRIQKNMFGE